MIDTAPIRRSGRHILNAIYIVIMMLAFRQHRGDHMTTAILMAATFWGMYVVGTMIKRRRHNTDESNTI